MVVTLSDYILEQEVSTASCDDILIEEAYAAMEVNRALANAYAKEITMLEYAVEFGSDLYVEAEGGTGTEEKTGFGAKVGKFFKTIWDAIVNAFKWIGRQFAKLWGWIKGLFSKKTADTLRNVATSDKVDEAVIKIKEDLKSKNLRLEDFEEIIATKGVRKFIENGNKTYDQLTQLLGELKSAITDVDTANLNKILAEIKKLTSELAKGKGTLALAGSGSTGALKFGANMTEKGLSPQQTEQNRDLLNQMADFVEWTAGEGRAAIGGLQDKMQKFDYELDQISRSLPDVNGENTTNKQKDLVSAFKGHSDEILNNCTNIARQVGGINCIYSACRAATQVAYKNAEARQAADHVTDMAKRITGYVMKHPDASATDIANAVGATAEDIKKMDMTEIRRQAREAAEKNK